MQRGSVLQQRKATHISVRRTWRPMYFPKLERGGDWGWVWCHTHNFHPADWSSCPMWNQALPVIFWTEQLCLVSTLPTWRRPCTSGWDVLGVSLLVMVQDAKGKAWGISQWYQRLLLPSKTWGIHEKTANMRACWKCQVDLGFLLLGVGVKFWNNLEGPRQDDFNVNAAHPRREAELLIIHHCVKAHTIMDHFRKHTHTHTQADKHSPPNSSTRGRWVSRPLLLKTTHCMFYPKGGKGRMTRATW